MKAQWWLPAALGVVLTGIVACNNQPHPDFASASAGSTQSSSASAAPAKTFAVTGNIVILLRQDEDSTDPKWEARHAIAEGTTLVWRANQEFSILVNKKKDPCAKLSAGMGKNIYKAVTTDNKEWIAQCTVVSPLKQRLKFEVDAPQDPNHKRKPSIHKVTSCSGCAAEQDPDS